MLTVTSSQIFSGIGKYADGILDHPGDYMELALKEFFFCMFFPIFFSYFFTIDLLEDFGIHTNLPSSI